MKFIRFFLLSLFAFCAPTLHAYSACSVSNLTRCLDSACDTATESGAASRCIICGTSAAIPENADLEKYKFGGVVTGLQTLTLGHNMATSLDTKNAPSDPGARYSWASNECLKKNKGCAASDIDNNYDKLIAASCRAAMPTKEYETIFAKWKANEKTSAKCSAEITNCLNVDRRCGFGFINCETNTDLDKYFSECLATDALGCDEFAKNIRANVTSGRDDVFAAKQELLNDIVNGYQSARAQKLATVRTGCNDGTVKDECITTVCSYISGDCAENKTKKAWAAQLCGFIDVACGRVK